MAENIQMANFQLPIRNALAVYQDTSAVLVRGHGKASYRSALPSSFI